MTFSLKEVLMLLANCDSSGARRRALLLSPQKLPSKPRDQVLPAGCYRERGIAVIHRQPFEEKWMGWVRKEKQILLSLPLLKLYIGKHNTYITLVGAFAR